MLSQKQIDAMLMLHNRRDSIFFQVPRELIEKIGDYDQGPDSDIAKALQHAAYARQEDVTALLAMLEDNPSLLLQVGNVKTPGGDEVKRVTLYEFLLGAGDYELAKKVQGYFAEIENGEQERMDQYKRYQPHIKGLLNQEPYDLSPLIELVKIASPEEVRDLLDNDFTGENKLCTAIIQFRRDWAPRTLLKPCMHYNYASLQHAFQQLESEWNILYKTSGGNFDKINLVWRQLIGFEMRRLPGIDRCIMAQSLSSVIGENEVLVRSYKITRTPEHDFPVTVSDDSLNGLGGAFAIDFVGSQAIESLSLRFWNLSYVVGNRSDLLLKLCETKTSNLQNLCSDSQLINQAHV